MNSVYYAEVNITCIIMMVMVLIASMKIKRGTRMNAYRGMVICDILLCVGDMIAGICRGKFFPGDRFVLWTSNLLYFIASYGVAVSWIIACMYLLHKKINKTALIITLSAAVLASLFFISTIFNGLCFTINEQNLYARGPFIWIQWVVVLPCIGIPTVSALFFSKAEKRTRVVVSTIVLFPLVAFVLQMLVYGVTVCQVGITCSNLMLYIFIQSKAVNDVQSRASLLNEILNTDTLTNLQNRRAYETRLNDLIVKEWVGVIFADLNGLKRMNDTFGHAAGDKLICDFSEWLREYFDVDEIYRISGDEFVILSERKEHYFQIYDKMIADVGDTACIGRADGIGSEVIELVSVAEQDMYKYKSEFYARTGLERRK